MGTSWVISYMSEIENSLRAGNATEHTYRPALKRLFEALGPGITATNEPKRAACGAPDYVISRNTVHGPLSLGYVEAKDIGEPLHRVEQTNQMKRYLAALPNLILTDYVEFNWYVDGIKRESSQLARVQGDRLIPVKGGVENTTELIGRFLDSEPQPVSRPHDLAIRMARLTHMVRDIIIEAFAQDEASELLRGWRTAFSQVLIPGLDDPSRTPEFADMFAQTLAYGLFSARVMDTTPGFSRQEAQRLIPRTNPFLRRFFSEISGVRMDDEPYAGFVDDVATLLAHTDIDAVLADFGQRTRQQDPVAHFYETFLAAYDPRLRESRGVYYTPDPVVSYLVRSVNILLKTHFDCSDGLADHSTIAVSNFDPSLKVKGRKETRKTTRSHKVIILDPACGTGTFLYKIIELIREQFMGQGNAGLWPGYVAEHLLPRLFGFEIMMAPYAMAHFKLGLELAGRDLPPQLRSSWAYDLQEHQRLGVFMTDALEGPHEWTGLPLFTQFLADETEAANRVKRDLPVMVVLGNPPYSGISANMSPEITRMVDAYKTVDGMPLGERKTWLQDDYVKFIRFGQQRIERTGRGILAYITNHRYLDNPTFRGMRQSLLSTFTDIYILDLHGHRGDSTLKERKISDENVFDIEQGVAIGIFVKENESTKTANVHYAEMRGSRSFKYRELSEQDLGTTKFDQLQPSSPFYFFVPRDESHRQEFDAYWKTDEMFVTHSTGMTTARDAFVVDIDEAVLLRRIGELRSNTLSDEEIREKYFAGKGSLKYSPGDSRGWKLPSARRKIREDLDWESRAEPCLYRPFDTRSVYYVPWMVDWPRSETMKNLLVGPNIALLTNRQVNGEFRHVFCGRTIVTDSSVSSASRERTYVFPLYTYRENDQLALTDQTGTVDIFPSRSSNLAPRFTAELTAKTGLEFIAEDSGDLQSTIGPEDVFHYIYAILHAPTYRARYADFLKSDFPRIPLTSDTEVLRGLCTLGGELVELHLMEKVLPTAISYPIPGENAVKLVRFTPVDSTDYGRVWINPEQYFEGIPSEVWSFHLGGFQVCEKWLKDRKGTTLTYNDLSHYRQVVAVISETLVLMSKVDTFIQEKGGWPIK